MATTEIAKTYCHAESYCPANFVSATDANQPLSVALTKFAGQYDSAWQYVFAISVVAIAPVVLLFALIERRLVAGLTAGSVK